MFRFLLKKKYNFFHNDLVLVFAFILHFSIPAVLANLITDFFYNQLGNFMTFLISSFIIISNSFLIFAIFKAINKYRESTPYEIEKVIENNKENAFELADELPKVLVINGDGRNVELLEEENISDMDAFISVTGNSETNIMSCLVAKSKGVKKTIALVENMDYFELSQSIGIDTLINKKLLAANNIFRYIRKGEVIAMTKLNNMNAELLEFKVKATSKICNKLIKDVEFPRSAIVGGVIRNGEGLIALGGFKVEEGDYIVVCCLPRSIKEVEKLFL